MEQTIYPFLIATIIQAFLYVLYLISLTFALRWLLYKEERWILRSHREVNWFMLTIATILFAFSTGDVVVSALLQSIYIRPESNNDAIGKQLLIAGTTLEVLTYLIIDAVLIFRCWVVYQRSWRAVCVPLLFWLSNITLMAMFVPYSATGSINDIPFRDLPVFYACNFATNLYTTCAIIYRVLRVANATNNRSSILYRVCRIVAGTGILYASTSFAILVAAFLLPKDLVAYFVCNAINFSTAGISFNLLLIRVGQLRADIEMDIHASTPDANMSDLLSTLQFGVPSITIDDKSFNSESGYRGDAGEASIQDKRQGFDLGIKHVPATLVCKDAGEPKE